MPLQRNDWSHPGHPNENVLRPPLVCMSVFTVAISHWPSIPLPVSQLGHIEGEPMRRGAFPVTFVHFVVDWKVVVGHKNWSRMYSVRRFSNFLSAGVSCTTNIIITVFVMDIYHHHHHHQARWAWTVLKRCHCHVITVATAQCGMLSWQQ